MNLNADSFQLFLQLMNDWLPHLWTCFRLEVDVQYARDSAYTPVPVFSS